MDTGWTARCLTAPEMQAILAGLRSLDSVSGTRRYVQLMEKLSAGNSTLISGGTHMLIDLSSWYKSSLAPKIEAIQNAMEAAPPGTFYLRRAQRHFGAQRGALLSGLSLVHLVSVGLVPN